MVIRRDALGNGVLGLSTLRRNRSVRSESLPARGIQTLTANQLPGRSVSTRREQKTYR